MKNLTCSVICLLTLGVGCADDGYDLMLVTDSFPDKVDLILDYENGQSPQEVPNQVHRQTYSLTLDGQGSARINCTWPISRFHRTFVVLPTETLSESEFSMTFEGMKMRRSNGVTVTGQDNGTVYSYSLKRRELPGRDNN